MTTTVWPFSPNWRESLEVQVSYRTDIVTSRSGREQRRALRQTPRKQISYTITVDRDDRRTLSRLLSSVQASAFTVADPTRRTALVKPSPASAGTMTLLDMPVWVAETRQLFIGDALVTVTDITDDVITFTPVNAAALPTGTVVRPALDARVDGTVSLRHPVNRVAEGSVTLAIDPGSETVDAQGPGIYILDGREMFDFRPNWSEGVEQNFDWPVEQVDFGFGRLRTFQPITAGWLTQSATFVGIGAAEVEGITAFFHRQRGRRGEFLMPTGMDDISPRSEAVEGAYTLTVVGTEVFDAYAEDTRFKAIALRTQDGRMMLRTVSGMAVSSGDTVLTLTQPWLIGVPAAQVANISWLAVFRFSSDDLTFEWQTDELAQTKIGMRGLEALAAENPITGLDEAARWLLEAWGGLHEVDAFDYLVNIAYPAVFFYPYPWNVVHESVGDYFDQFVNIEIPESIG